MPQLTKQQYKYIAWTLDRNRSVSNEDKFTSVLTEAQVDLNPHQIDAALFAFRSPLSREGLKHAKKLLLTATPLQNNVKELFGLDSIIDENYFGGLKSFSDQYGKTELRSDSVFKELRSRIKPIIHRTQRSDVLISHAFLSAVLSDRTVNETTLFRIN